MLEGIKYNEKKRNRAKVMGARSGCIGFTERVTLSTDSRKRGSSLDSYPTLSFYTCEHFSVKFKPEYLPPLI